MVVGRLCLGFDLLSIITNLNDPHNEVLKVERPLCICQKKKE